MHGMTMPVGGVPCESRSRPALEPTGDDRAGGPDIRLPSAGPILAVLTTSKPCVSFSSIGPASRSATSRPRPRPHTGFDPGSDPVVWECYGGSMGDSAVQASEPGIPLWRRGMGNPPLFYHYHSHANPMCAFSRGRARSSVLGIRPSVSGPRCRVPGTEQGNRAIKRNARLMLRKRAHGVCYAKHGMALQCHRLSLKSLGRRGRSRGPGRTGAVPVDTPAVGRGRPDGRDHIQSHSVHIQSTYVATYSPRMWPRAVHVRGSTWTPWRSTSKGVTKGMVEGAGSGMAGVRDDLQQRVERRTPPSLSA